MPNISKKDRLEQILNIVNDGLSKDEFLNAFQKVTDHVFRVEKKLIEKIDFQTKQEKLKLEALKQEFKQTIQEAKKDSDTTLSGFRTRTTEVISRLFARNEVSKRLNERLKEVDSKLKEIDKKLSEVKNGKPGYDGRYGIDGKDADEEKFVKSVLDKLEDSRFEIEQINGLQKELEELRELRTRTRGGGVSAMGVAQAFKHILHTEQPSGLINGVNTEFTVDFPIFAVLGFSLNGKSIAELPNYTVSNKTITFSAAIPAAYSDKDFEVKYIST